MNYWIFKSEPDTFSIEELKKRQKEVWDGVRNYQARNFLRDNVKVGDQVLFYHSSCDIPGIAGIAKVTRNNIVDPTQFDKKSDYYDPKSTPENPRWITVEVGFVKKFDEIISRDEIRGEKKLADIIVLKKGMRLSIMPITQLEFEILNNLRK